jgi:hypothetical protein
MVISVGVDAGKAFVCAGSFYWCVRCAVGALAPSISAIKLVLIGGHFLWAWSHTVVVVHRHVISRLAVVHGVEIRTDDTRGVTIRAGPFGHEAVDGLNARSPTNPFARVRHTW